MNWYSALRDFGFPAALVVFLLTRMERRLAELAEPLRELLAISRERRRVRTPARGVEVDKQEKTRVG